MMLTDKQQAFVEQYLVDLNATQAAIRAGYSAKTAASQGERLLRNVEISEALAAAQKVRSERTEITQDYVLKSLLEVAETNLAKVTDPESNVEAMVDAKSATRALELLGKHLGMFVNKLEVTTTRYVARMPAPAPDEATWLAQSKKE